MARRKLEEKNIRKLTRTGNSMSITLPIEWVRKLKWRERQKLHLSLRGGKIVIEDWPAKNKKP